MPRLPYAAKDLIAAVTDLKPKAKAEPVGDADGLNVHRTIKFDKPTSKWLAPLLEEIGDPRITGLELTDAGYLHVTFASGRPADIRGRFPLAAAETVSQSED